MRLKELSLGLFVGMMFLGLSGCVFFLLSAGAFGGYTVSRDTIQGEYDAEFSDAWRSAVKACEALGTVSLQDGSTGTVEAMVDNAKVNVTISQITPSAIRVRVKARRAVVVPRLGTAEKVFIRIAQGLMD